MASLTSNAPPAPKPFDSSDRADLAIITSDGTALYVVKALLIYASQFFANLLGDSLPDETHEGLPVYRASEDCRTMCAVLRLCYPIDIAPSEMIVDIPVVEAFDKYMMEDAKKRWRDSATFKASVKTEPLRMYAIACRYRWGDIARSAVKAVLSIPLPDWQTSEELCNITGMDYHVLVQYYAHCSAAVEHAFSPRNDGEITIPLQNPRLAVQLRIMVHDSDREKSTSLTCCCPNLPSKDFVPIKVPCWVPRLVEYARKRLRSRPGRAVMCDEALMMTLNDEDIYPIRQSVVGQVCQMINAGVQVAINKVNFQLNFKEDSVE